MRCTTKCITSRGLASGQTTLLCGVSRGTVDTPQRTGPQLGVKCMSTSSLTEPVLGNLPESTLAKWWSGSIFNKLWYFWLRWSLTLLWPLFLDQRAGVLLKHKTNFSRIKKRIAKMSWVSEKAVDKKGSKYSLLFAYCNMSLPHVATKLHLTE